MRVVVSGSSGLIGTALCDALRRRADDVRPLVRRPAHPGEIGWDPVRGILDPDALAGADAVVHLAGAGIGDRRWTAERRRVLAASRVDSTDLLARVLARMSAPPTALVCASAIGIYGDRGDEVLTEASSPGDGFLAGLCRRWEAAAGPAVEAGVRTVFLRSGIVLSPSGGALGRQLPLFRLGLGGRLGSGRQWTSWVSLDDEVGAVLHALDSSAVSGPLNVVSPAPVTNRQLTASLGRALHRPAVMVVPAPVLRLALGRGLTDEALLASQRVSPTRLESAGFGFRHADIDSALAALLRR
jgi:uncharacterized protein